MDKVKTIDSAVLKGCRVDNKEMKGIKAGTGGDEGGGEPDTSGDHQNEKPGGSGPPPPVV